MAPSMYDLATSVSMPSIPTVPYSGDICPQTLYAAAQLSMQTAHSIWDLMIGAFTLSGIRLAGKQLDLICHSSGVSDLPPKNEAAYVKLRSLSLVPAISIPVEVNETRCL